MLYSMLLSTFTSRIQCIEIPDYSQRKSAAEAFDAHVNELLRKDHREFKDILKHEDLLNKFFKDPIINEYIQSPGTIVCYANGTPHILSKYLKYLYEKAIIKLPHSIYREEIKDLKTLATDAILLDDVGDIYNSRAMVDLLSCTDAPAWKFVVLPQLKDGFTSLVIAKADHTNKAQVAFFVNAIKPKYDVSYWEERFNRDHPSQWSPYVLDKLETEEKKYISVFKLTDAQEKKLINDTHAHVGQTYGQKIPFIDASFKLTSKNKDWGNHAVYILALTKAAIHYLKENPTQLDALCNQGKFKEAAALLRNGIKAHLPYYYQKQTDKGLRYKSHDDKAILQKSYYDHCQLIHKHETKNNTSAS